MSQVRQPHEEESPPLFRTWNRVYTAVLVYLAAMIGLFALFREAFTP